MWILSKWLSKLMPNSLATVADFSRPDSGALDEAQLNRRARMNDLVEQKCYGRAAIFSKVSRINPSLVSQYRTGARPITERTVAMIETAFALPGFFSMTDAEADVAASVALAAVAEQEANYEQVRRAANAEAREAGHVSQAQHKFCDACDDLAILLPEDAAVFVSMIKAAATKVLRARAEIAAIAASQEAATAPGSPPAKQSRAT